MFSNFGIGGLYNGVIPGYSVTFPPVNFCSWAATGRGAIRSYGLSNQYVQYPNGYPSQAYWLANNMYLSQSNPMLFGIADFGNGFGCYC